MTDDGSQDQAPDLATLLDDLEWRGILHATTPGVAARLASGRRISAYIGFDPTADSLHIGHLIPIFGLIRLQEHGGRPVALVGGGTGMIGDPSGRSSERNLLDVPTLERNVAAIRAQLERFLDFAPGPAQATMANNLEWLGSISLIDYLRDVGKHFTVPYMLGKDSVQTRLERGLSFTEFSYMTLQAFDFATLYRRYGVEMQMGGADQWGNITAGLELIRRTSGGEADESPAHGIAYKLLLSPSGAKFGKSEVGDSVWLDPARTTPYAFYQYWVNVDDRDVATYLRWFTTWSREAILALDVATAERPEAREAQRRLALDVTTRVHGSAAADEALAVSQAMFQREPVTDAGLLASVFAATSGSTVAPEVLAGGAAVLLAETGLAPSRGEARRLVQGGAITINGVRIADAAAALPAPIAGEWLEVRVGKRNRAVVRVVAG
ncbi:MAG TPA: tyrosine--tRNA ligase [Candidatus Limnocylindrales bacterium]|nr:tyrosine--tRNA ligase [Candidatus Limnocylindrales bacterium]